MIVHQYDNCGIYLGPVEDYGGPMPHNCAAEAPPQAPPENHKYRRLANGDFELVEDYRGRIGYKIESGEAVEIKECGPWPAGLARESKPGSAYEWKGGVWIYNPRLDNPGPGYEFNESEEVWVKTRFSVFNFLNLFTTEEKAAIKRAIAEGDYDLAAIYDSFITADYVDVRNQATVENVRHLAAKGLLRDDKRPDEILNGQPR